MLQGCGTFAISAWATHIAAANGNDVSVGAYYRPIFITIGVTFWSVRLAGFLFYRILQTKTDKYAPSSQLVCRPCLVKKATNLQGHPNRFVISLHVIAVVFTMCFLTNCLYVAKCFMLSLTRLEQSLGKKMKA
jgi:hypothetical protein